jgi:hypothetical protein
MGRLRVPAARYSEQVASVALGETALTFRDFGGDGESGAIALIDEETRLAVELSANN